MGMAKQAKTFLVIEDTADDAMLIQRAFKSVGDCQAFICRNLSEARAYVQGSGMYQNRDNFPFPNAVISDLHLGFESGVEFVKWMKSNAPFASMPVIILTGTANAPDCEEARQAGAVDILKKPARYEDLKMMLHDLAAKLCG
jgi:CheY-like chemotaxis protein